MKLLIFLAVLAAFVATSVAFETCGYRYSLKDYFVVAPAWTYDSYLKRCIKINDDGCTENRFGSKTECEDEWLK